QRAEDQALSILESEDHRVVIQLAALADQPDPPDPQEDDDREQPQPIGVGVDVALERVEDQKQHQNEDRSRARGEAETEYERGIGGDVPPAWDDRLSFLDCALDLRI